jgi:hypothetical protein
MNTSMKILIKVSFDVSNLQLMPFFFVQKKNGYLQMCVDYRGLNRLTIKN